MVRSSAWTLQSNLVPQAAWRRYMGRLKQEQAQASSMGMVKCCPAGRESGQSSSFADAIWNKKSISMPGFIKLWKCLVLFFLTVALWHCAASMSLRSGSTRVCFSKHQHIPDMLILATLSFQALGFCCRWEFKRQHWDSVMLFKMGKFYEMFEMDAHTGCEVLGLTYMRVSLQTRPW